MDWHHMEREFRSVAAPKSPPSFGKHRGRRPPEDEDEGLARPGHAVWLVRDLDEGERLGPTIRCETLAETGSEMIGLEIVAQWRLP